MRHQNRYIPGAGGEISMRFWRKGITGGLIAGGLVGLAFYGCDEPSDIVPIAPPGAYIPKTSPDAEPAQAVGETAPTAVPTSAKTDSPQAKMAHFKPALPGSMGVIQNTEGGVKYETLKEGSGPELKPGQKAVIHYEGKLENGTVFDSTRPSKEPRPFTFGSNSVIQGWEEAIPGMKVGEIRKLTIPPEKAYGKSGRPPTIPANATLIFEVELVDIQ
jgi:FKBP-type peptidyl-prolyl cis-trans isomerase FkpA